MPIFNIKLLFVLTLAVSLLVTGCGEIKEAIEENRKESFVRSFNANAYMFSDETRIRHAAAAIDPGTGEVEVSFYLGEGDGDEIENTFLEGVFPSLMILVCKELPDANALIEDGHVVYTNVYDKSDSLISRMPIDKARIDGFKKLIDEQEGDFIKCSGVSEQVKQIIVACNQGLPVTDPSTGIVVSSITLSEDRKMVYTNIAPEGSLEGMDEELGKLVLLESLRMNASIIQLKGTLRGDGIEYIRYEYVDEAGNLLLGIDIGFDEF